MAAVCSFRGVAMATISGFRFSITWTFLLLTFIIILYYYITIIILYNIIIFTGFFQDSFRIPWRHLCNLIEIEIPPPLPDFRIRIHQKELTRDSFISFISTLICKWTAEIPTQLESRNQRNMNHFRITKSAKYETLWWGGVRFFRIFQDFLRFFKNI